LSQVVRTYGNVLELSFNSNADRNLKRPKRKVKWNAKKLICTILVLYLGANFGYWHYKIDKVNHEIENLEMKKMALELEKNKLEEQKKMVQGEKYVEKLARENLGLIKPGEKLILLAEPGEVMPLDADENAEIRD